MGFQLVACVPWGHEIPLAFAQHHCLQLSHHLGAVHLAWEDALRPQPSGSPISSATGVGVARHLVLCTTVFAVNSVLLTTLRASKLPKLCSYLHLGTSLAANLCVLMPS